MFRSIGFESLESKAFGTPDGKDFHPFSILFKNHKVIAREIVGLVFVIKLIEVKLILL